VRVKKSGANGPDKVRANNNAALELLVEKWSAEDIHRRTCWSFTAAEGWKRIQDPIGWPDPDKWPPELEDEDILNRRGYSKDDVVGPSACVHLEIYSASEQHEERFIVAVLLPMWFRYVFIPDLESLLEFLARYAPVVNTLLEIDQKNELARKGNHQ
jgi:hypothetical protein